MKTLHTALTLAMATLSLSGVSTAQSASQNVASDAEREAAMEPVRAYVKAHETGNGAFILAAFHKDARLAGSINGSFVTAQSSCLISEMMRALPKLYSIIPVSSSQTICS
jgi:Putative lumazine-binding